MRVTVSEDDLPSTLRGLLRGFGEQVIEYQPKYNTEICVRCNEQAILRPFPIQREESIELFGVCRECQDQLCQELRAESTTELDGGVVVDMPEGYAQGGL